MPLPDACKSPRKSHVRRTGEEAAGVCVALRGRQTLCTPTRRTSQVSNTTRRETSSLPPALTQTAQGVLSDSRT